jgi:cold shock CspA family protein
VNLREKYGFIQPEEGEQIHFKISAFRGQPEIGLQVEFEVDESPDKNNKLSPTAVRIHPIKD